MIEQFFRPSKLEFRLDQCFLSQERQLETDYLCDVRIGSIPTTRPNRPSRNTGQRLCGLWRMVPRALLGRKGLRGKSGNLDHDILDNFRFFLTGEQLCREIERDQLSD